MFEASAPFLFFDYFRVPYGCVGHDEGVLNRLSSPAGRALLWPRDHDASDLLPFDEYHVRDTPLFARVMRNDVSADLLGDGWADVHAVTDRHGTPVASIRRSEAGDVFLPFDPAEAMLSLWSERYETLTPSSTRNKRLAIAAYYRVRPMLPRFVQISLRRAFSRVQARRPFPRWPVESALHDLYDLLFELVASVAGEPVPFLAPWPAPYRWALVLTHDVETRDGYEQLGTLREVESALGFRSSWNFVARRYEVEDEVVSELVAAGNEVGVHGLYHDGRDLESRETLEERLPEMRAAAERWGAVGFRSPATHRSWDLMPLLGFDYDSSYFDSDPFEPQAGGSCTWFPFFIGDIVELPITLLMDHTMLVIMRRRDPTLWIEKAQFLRERGGMALMITHPDYQLGGVLPEVYRGFLEQLAEDPELWRPLPRELAAWWRRRGASTLKRHNGGWAVEGPAAGEAAIAYAARL